MSLIESTKELPKVKALSISKHLEQPNARLLQNDFSSQPKDLVMSNRK